MGNCTSEESKPAAPNPAAAKKPAAAATSSATPAAAKKPAGATTTDREFDIFNIEGGHVDIYSS